MMRCFALPILQFSLGSPTLEYVTTIGLCPCLQGHESAEKAKLPIIGSYNIFASQSFKVLLNETQKNYPATLESIYPNKAKATRLSIIILTGSTEALQLKMSHSAMKRFQVLSSSLNHLHVLFGLRVQL